MQNRYNLSGNKFGKLTVIEHVGHNSCGANRWKCVCDCGNVTTVVSTELRRGTSKSCGCSRYKDISGRKFGRLTAIKVAKRIVENVKKGIISFWLCDCECGQSTQVRIDALLSGSIRSCGCLQKDITRQRTSRKCGLIPGKYWSSIRHNAIAKNRDLEITIEYIWNLFKAQDGRCALTGIPIGFGDNQTASLDRINSNIGYVEGNVQWIHKTVNTLKSNMVEKDLIDWSILIVQHAARLGKIISLDWHSSFPSEASTQTQNMER